MDHSQSALRSPRHAHAHADAILCAYASTLYHWHHARYGSHAWEYWYGAAVSLAWSYSLIEPHAAHTLDAIVHNIVYRALPEPAPVPR